MTSFHGAFWVVSDTSPRTSCHGNSCQKIPAELFLCPCSSIGMVKGALESLTGDNLFGGNGSSWSVVYSDIDAHNRNRTVFDTILPRESNSKVAHAKLASVRIT